MAVYVYTTSRPQITSAKITIRSPTPAVICPNPPLNPLLRQPCALCRATRHGLRTCQPSPRPAASQPSASAGHAASCAHPPAPHAPPIPMFSGLDPLQRISLVRALTPSVTSSHQSCCIPYTLIDVQKLEGLPSIPTSIYPTLE